MGILATIIIASAYALYSIIFPFVLASTTWGGLDYESPRSIIIEGEDIYVVGRTTSYGIGESNVFLLKYDKDGELQWNSTWESATLDVAEAFASDGDMIAVTGFLTYFEPYNREVFLLKYDMEGRLIWNTTWGGVDWEGEPSIDSGSDVEVLKDDIYVVGTTTHRADSLNEQDVLLLKYGSEGELLWQKQYGKNHTYDYGFCLEVLDDELYLAGHRLTIESGNRIDELYLLKLDLNGNVLWNRTYDEVSGHRIQPHGLLIKDRIIYAAGSLHSKDSGWRYFICKVDLGGELQWVHVSERDDLSTRGSMEVEDDLLLLLTTSTDDPSNSEVSILEFDLDGNLLGNFTWRSESNETAFDMSVSGDTIYLMGMIDSTQKSADIFLSAIENPYKLEENQDSNGFRIPGFPREALFIGVITCLAFFILSSRRRMFENEVVRAREATERDIQLNEEERTLPASKLAHIIFSKAIPGRNL